ncbi:MAG: hypothetical protein ACU0DK_03400 [Pseudooceanicola sp.]
MTLSKTIAAAFLLPFLAAPALALDVQVEDAPQSLTIPANDVANAVMGCASGVLVSGGYALTSGPADRSSFAFIANFSPVPGLWTVRVQNNGSETVTVGFDMSVLCLTD